MYNPETFLTKKIVLNVLSEFEWPEAYETVTENLIEPKTVEVKFPSCTLLFEESFESDMYLWIRDPNDPTGKYMLADRLVLLVYGPILNSNPDFVKPEYTGFFSPGSCELKVINGIRDLCTMTFAYLKPCLSGDFELARNHTQSKS